MPSGKCRICGCTDMDGCPAGCAWAEPDLCTVCADFRAGLVEYLRECRQVTVAGVRRLVKEVTA